MHVQTGQIIYKKVSYRFLHNLAKGGYQNEKNAN